MTQKFLYISIYTTKAFTFTTTSIVVGRYHIEISSGTRFYFNKFFKDILDFSNVDTRTSSRASSKRIKNEENMVQVNLLKDIIIQ